MKDSERIYHLVQLTADELGQQDRERTVVILPVGILENHGAHLVIGTDTLIAKAALLYVSRELVKRLPEWAVLLFPAIEFGTQVIDELRTSGLSASSFPISSRTLRNLVAEVGDSIARSGFKYIVALNRHGSPLHTNSISSACRFISQTRDVRMWHVRLGTTRELIERANVQAGNIFSQDVIDQIVHEIHAGCLEVSYMLHIHPELVKSVFGELEPRPISNFSQACEVAQRPDWNFYFGFPALANSNFGRELARVIADSCIESIIDILKGGQIPDDIRHANQTRVEQIEMDERQQARELAFMQEFDAWFEKQ